MKVSVVVPIYNKEKFLENCLNSLINQTLDSIEYLLIEDCSTDNSREIASNYQKRYPNKIKLFCNEANKGVSLSRNFGISKATGEYIGFVDADDIVDPEYFEVLYERAVQHNYPDMVRARLVMYNQQGNVISNNSSQFDNNTVLSGKMLPKYLLRENPGCYTKIYRKDFLTDHDFPNMHWEDTVFHDKKVIASSTILYTNDVKYHYMHDQVGRDMTSYQQIGSHILDFLDGYDIVTTHAKELGKYELFQYVLKKRQIRRLQILMSHIVNWNIPIEENDIVEPLLKYLCNYIDLCYGNWQTGGSISFPKTSSCQMIAEYVYHNGLVVEEKPELVKEKMKQLLIPFDKK